MSAEDYAYGAIWAAEGARVALMVCVRCGAAVLLHREIDTTAVHDAWHNRIEVEGVA